MTATEVHVRVNMIRQLLGPVYGRLQSEWLQTLIERCFGLAFRAGVLGQPPQSLGGRDFHVRYISPLARAQRMEDVNAMDRIEQGLMQKAEMRPETLDVYDWDAAEELRGQYLGVPGQLMRTDKELVAIRKQRSDAQAQQQQQEQQAQMMQAVGGNENSAQIMGAMI